MEVRVIAYLKDYNTLMDTITGALVNCGYHIISDIREYPANGGQRRGYIQIEDGGPSDVGKCGNVEVKRI